MNRYYLIRMLGSSRLPYADAADDIMQTEDFREYVATHGYHFTPKLAELASKRLANSDGSMHHWTAEQAAGALKNALEGHTDGDACYLANMLYSDYYPTVAKTEQEVLAMAEAKLRDKDGYEGQIFLNWVADMIGRGQTVDWSYFI